MAAINGFLLILKNTASFAFTRGIGGVFNFLGKLTVSVCNCIGAYCALTYYPEMYARVNSPIGPMFIVFAITYTISHLFMSMYTTTATCVLHCLFADVDICKQLDYDEVVGRNRPKEMKSIVRVLSKAKPSESKKDETDRDSINKE